MLQMVTDNEVANVVLEYVDIKVADRIDSFKVENLLMMNVEAAVWISSVWFVGILNFDVSSYNKRLTNLWNSSELVDIVLC